MKLPVDGAPPPAGPEISVIVPCGPGSRPQVGGLLTALAEQGRETPPFEVVLVDNGASLAASELARPGVAPLCVREPVPGAYAARNRGVAVARGEILAFTDADCLPTPGWLAAGVTALSATAADIVGGKVSLFARRSGRPNVIERHQLVHAFDQEYFVRELAFATTANLFAPRNLFAAAAGFLAALYSGGDAEWCQRQVAAGARIGYAAEAEVHHPARGSWLALAHQRRRTTGGRLLRARGVGHPPRSLTGVRSSYRRPLARLAYYRSHPLLATRRARLGFLAVELFLYLTMRGEQLRLLLGGMPVRH